MANNPFNTNYIVLGEGGESIILNSDQIVKIIAKRADQGWEVTFIMSDGTRYSVNNQWSKQFVKATFNKE